MIQEGSRRHCIGLLATVEFHKDLSGGAGHAKWPLAGVDVMTSSQEIGIEGWVMQQSLEDDSLVTGLSHVPDTTSTTTRARVLVCVALDIDLRRGVFDPSVLAVYQIVSYSTREH
jgi:hypothetical protein